MNQFIIYCNVQAYDILPQIYIIFLKATLPYDWFTNDYTIIGYKNYRIKLESNILDLNKTYEQRL